jgi:hypothetical protein
MVVQVFPSKNMTFITHCQGILSLAAKGFMLKTSHHVANEDQHHIRQGWATLMAVRAT